MKNLLLLFFISTILTAFPHRVFSQKSIFGSFTEYYKTETAKKANRKLAANDVDGAIEILDKAIDKDKDLFEAYRTRSFIRQYYKNDFAGAISDLNKAIEIKPDDIDVYILRASLKKKFNADFAGALQDYEKALKYRPESVFIYTLRANTKAQQRDFDGALEEIRNALKIQPENIDSHLSLTNFLIEKNESDKAFEHLQAFLADYVKKRNGKLPKIRGETVKKKIPDEFNKPDGIINSVPVTRYSQMYFNVISPEDLLNQQSEIREARSLAKAFFQLSVLLVSRKMIDEALENLATAINIDKNHERAYGLRGAIYLSRGEWEKAIAEFDEAIDIADDPVFYLNRGTAFLLTGKDKESKKDFDKFIEIYPAGKTLLEQRIAETKKGRPESRR